MLTLESQSLCSVIYKFVTTNMFNCHGTIAFMLAYFERLFLGIFIRVVFNFFVTFKKMVVKKQQKINVQMNSLVPRTT